jgi:hypothetical protein
MLQMEQRIVVEQHLDPAEGGLDLGDAAVLQHADHVGASQHEDAAGELVDERAEHVEREHQVLVARARAQLREMDMERPAALAVRAEALNVFRQGLFFGRPLQDGYLRLPLHDEALRSSTRRRSRFPLAAGRARGETQQSSSARSDSEPKQFTLS